MAYHESDMELIRDLVFGETSRIYKAGLFSVEDIQSNSNPLKGIAIDRQKGGPSVTQLFLYKYLGCEYLADAAETLAGSMRHLVRTSTRRSVTPIPRHAMSSRSLRR